MANKKKIVCAFTAVMMAFSVSGCNKNGADNSENSGTDKISNNSASTEKAGNFKADVIELSEEIGYIEKMFYDDDKLYIFNSSQTASYNEITQVINTKTKANKEIDLSVLPHGYIMYAAYTENKAFFVYSDNNNSARLCTYDTKNNKVGADTEVDDNSYISHIWTESDGNLGALVMRYKDTVETAHIVKYDGKTLDVISEISLNDKFNIAGNEIIAYVNEFPDGTFYVVNIKFAENDQYDVVVRAVNSKGEVLFTADDFSDISGYVSGVFRSRNGNLCICKTDDDFVLHVKEIDAASGKAVGSYKVDFGGYTFLLERFVSDDYDFMYSNDVGIYGYSFKNNSSTLVFKFGEDIDENFINCYNIYSCGDEVFMYTGVYGNYVRNVIISDIKGKVQSVFDPHTDEMDVCDAYAGNNRIYFAEQQDKEPEEGEYMYRRSYYFHMYDETGNKEKVFQIDDLDKLSSPLLQSISGNRSGDICLCIQDYSGDESITMSPAFFVADSDGKVKFKLSGNKDIIYINDVISAIDNDYLAYTDQNSELKYAVIDYDTGKLGKNVNFDIPDDAMFIAGDDEYDIYYISGQCLYGFKANGNTSDMILDVSETGYLTGDISSVNVINSSKIICTAYNSETGETDIVTFSREE